MNASSRPSGDHECETSFPPALETFSCADPSASITNNSSSVPTRRVKAIESPSGDQRGAVRRWRGASHLEAYRIIEKEDGKFVADLFRLRNASVPP